MNVIAEIQRINEAELQSGIAGTSASWHSKYKDSAWVYCGNLPHALTEGDIICVLSQFGEIEDINLVREEEMGKSKGFAFVKYEDARSCVLAVDNLTGSKILGRSIRVDHVEKYRLPKHLLEKEEAAVVETGPGHAYHDKELASQYNLQQGHDLFAPVADASGESKQRNSLSEEAQEDRRAAKQKRKEERAQKRREKEARRLEKEERKRRKRAKRYRDDVEGESQRRKKNRKQSRSRSPETG
jgi:RNA-binding motif X-linked protein 2